MILRRIGNKKKLAKQLYSLFPPHTGRIIPFFGAGGDFFYMPQAKHNIVNDIDSDVFNLFQVVMHRKDELEAAFRIMPIHQDLLKYWIKNKETEPIIRAIRFLFLSNLTYMGKMDCLNFSIRNMSKQMFFKGIDKTCELLQDVQFHNADFRKFFKDISYRDVDFNKPSHERENVFIYADPKYLGTIDTYKDSDEWTKQDSADLFNCLEATRCKFAYSEFNHPFILDQAKQRGLNVITIGERQNLKNRRIEILVTNYRNDYKLDL